MKTGFIIACILLFCSCHNAKSGEKKYTSQTSSVTVSSDIEDEYQYFPQCGFALQAPCLLEDVSQQSTGDFDLNYGGVTDENNPDKLTAYQVMAYRLPAGQRDMSKAELSSFVDEMMKKSLSGFSNSKAIYFGYEEYPGYVMECTTKGFAQKGIMFWKDEYIICLTVITNDNLESKFNLFTNSFEDINTIPPKSDKGNDSKVVHNSKLSKQFSNKYFSIKYPSSWQIVQEENQVTDNTAISLQIMEQQENDYDFLANINIIVSKEKRKEPAAYLVEQSVQGMRCLIPSYRLLSTSDDVVLDKGKGSSSQYTWSINGCQLKADQYIVKKADNTTFTITATMESSSYDEDVIVIQDILKSLVIN